MALSHVELYELLKPSVGEKAAGLMAEVIPPAADLSTKHDLARVEAELKGDIAHVEAELKGDIARVEIAVARLEGRLEAKIEASTKETMRWMLAFFIPVWAGTWGTVVAVLLRH